jgi:D-threonate/D-erythronate kinase
MPLLVVADDRTGALEVAGICADLAATSVPVAVFRNGAHDLPDHDDAVIVIDLQSRHLQPLEAATRAAAVTTTSTVRHAHKIDSTLRGNWAEELQARATATNERVVLVPAFPSLGRVCHHGAVFVHGVEVSESAARHDARRPVTSSRPSDHLRAAGVGCVDDIDSADRLRQWLSAGVGQFAVCDAATDHDIDALADAWADSVGVMFAGTAFAIGSAAAALRRRRRSSTPTREVASIRPLRTPSLIVCGSVHPTARRQIEMFNPTESKFLGDLVLRTRTTEGVTLLTSPIPAQLPVNMTDAEEVATALATAARHHMATDRPASVVIIGGDTTAAILGDTTVMVEGTVGIGMATWTLDTVVMATRSGGFGSDSALVDLYRGERHSASR